MKAVYIRNHQDKTWAIEPDLKLHNSNYMYSNAPSFYTRSVQKIRGQMLPFLHWLSKRAGITAHNTVTYMQLIGYNMLGVSRLRA